MELLIGTKKGLVAIDGQDAFEGRAVTALGYDGSSAWALVDERELWRRDDGWRLVAAIEDGEASSLLATDDLVLVGLEGAHLLRLDGETLSLVKPFEDAPARSTWYTPWGGPPNVRSMSRSNGTTYVNVHVGGILRTEDLGSFEPTIDIDTDVHEVAALGDEVLAALGVEGVARSTDGGASWDVTTEGLHGAYVRAVARAGDAVLITASSGPFAKDGGVYRDAGAGFERCSVGIPTEAGGNIDTGWLAARGSTAAVAFPDGTVYRSDDAGETWRVIADGLAEPQWLVFC